MTMYNTLEDFITAYRKAQFDHPLNVVVWHKGAKYGFLPNKFDDDMKNPFLINLFQQGKCPIAFASQTIIKAL